MEDQFREFGDRVAASVEHLDFERFRGLMAPWLQERWDAALLSDWLEESLDGLPHPVEHGLDGNSLSAAQLRELEGGYGPPSEPLPEEITDANFRKWMCVEFMPPEDNEEGYDACFDMWMAAVEFDGQLRVGYFEATEPD